MKKNYTFLLLLISIISHAQIKGKVTDEKGDPMPYVNIFIEGTFNGTTSNEFGAYVLNYSEKKSVVIQFQSLGYKTLKKSITPESFPYQLDVALQEEQLTLKEVTVSNEENPANDIIRKSIANRKKNSAKTDKFEADFYSRGIFRVKNVPKKFMGQEIGDMDGDLDTISRSGVIYLSETVSKITFQKPDKLKEQIIASKVAGDNKGFSYNTALSSDFDFYENYIDFNIKMISPIADNAFNYYKYQLESTFYDANNNLINKIAVRPKRDKEPVFEGYIYIVEDSWAIYGIDLDIKGYRMQQPILETMKLNQNFSYSESYKIWVKNIQSLDFEAGIFGIGFNGKFTHVFSNHQFKDAFDKKTFSKEVVSFVMDANKKDDNYWQQNRPVPLTEEETVTYIKKDSIATVRSSQKYLDSIDKKSNAFKFTDLIFGYSYRNSYKNWSLRYDGISDIASTSFNTVQGYNFNTGFSYYKWNEEKGTNTFAKAIFNYGLSDERLRVSGRFSHQFNRKNFANISISGGNVISQFNEQEPISKLVNSVSSLFFKDNYMKVYDKKFATFAYGQEYFNGLYASMGLTYEKRKPVFNTTDYTIIKNDDLYTSNDPLQPFNENSAPFVSHHIFKANIGTRIRFGQKYISRPDSKITIADDDYPTIFVNYEKAFSATNDDYTYDFVSARTSYFKTIGNKGDFGIQLKAGKFFNADDISFIDYQHFNGNLTHVNVFNNRFTSFNLLPYYSNSTNDAFVELHAEHNFKGYIMNKIPLLNKLQWNLVVGYHQLNVPTFKPYQEFTIGFDNIGFKKFRFLRVDYVRSYQNGFRGDGFMFGIKM